MYIEYRERTHPTHPLQTPSSPGPVPAIPASKSNPTSCACHHVSNSIPNEEKLPIVQVLRCDSFWLIDGGEFGWENEEVLGSLDAACGWERVRLVL